MGAQTKYYRRQAEHCKEMAAKANIEEMRASWLNLANRWLKLASGEPFSAPVADYREIDVQRNRKA
jgi:hypothetical protein